jgi:hypothetical protein
MIDTLVLRMIVNLDANCPLQLQYPSLPWVRYITQSGDIAVRLPDVSTNTGAGPR